MSPEKYWGPKEYRFEDTEHQTIVFVKDSEELSVSEYYGLTKEDQSGYTLRGKTIPAKYPGFRGRQLLSRMLDKVQSGDKRACDVQPEIEKLFSMPTYNEYVEN